MGIEGERIPKRFSVSDAIAPAMDFVKAMLFQPFRLNVWMALGAVAFIEALGSMNASWFNPNSGFNSGSMPSSPDLDQIRDFILGNMSLVFILGAVGVLLLLSLMALFQFLGARGTFIYIDNIVLRRAEIAEPWSRIRPLANSLFRYRVMIMLIWFVLSIIILSPALRAAFRGFLYDIEPEGFELALVIAVAVFDFFVSVVFSLISLFLTDFIAPVMYARGIYCRDAMHEFLSIAGNNKGQLVLYLLLRLVIGIVLGLATILVCCCTCCIGSLPVIAQAILQPVYLFKRVLPMYVLARLGEPYQLVK